MPLNLRIIEPITIGRKQDTIEGSLNHLSESNLVQSKEECVNRTLSNVIRQLASLGIHAIEIFDGLEAEAEGLKIRTEKLVQRAQLLDETVKDAKKRLEDCEEMPSEATRSLTHGDKVWSAKPFISAGLFTRETRPRPINDLYESCESTPNFELMQEFREDDLKCIKLYSDPGMFFQIWKKHALEEAEREKKALRRPKRSKKNEGRSVKKREKIRTQREILRDKEIAAGNIIIKPQQACQEDDSKPGHQKIEAEEPEDLDLPPLPPDFEDFEEFEEEETLPPPPPTPPTISFQEVEPPRPPPKTDAPLPPPPPPPAPSLLTQPQMIAAEAKPKEKKVIEAKAPDSRCDLLQQIREGKKLRKVESRKIAPKAKTLDTFEDVMKHVMDTRFAAMYSSSESMYSSSNNSEF